MRWDIVVAGALMAGCGFLTGAGAPIVMSAVDIVAAKLLEEAGKGMDDTPHSCEIENDPASGKLYMLCTFCYRLAPGAACQ